ncbi:MAG: hypothetical protein ACYDBJ_23625 [Aggregatilineales bacterium]
MVGPNSTSNRPVDSARATQTAKRVQPDSRSTAELKRVQARTRTRNTVANLITGLMLLLTMLALAWVAYQLNNPVVLNLSQLFRR